MRLQLAHIATLLVSSTAFAQTGLSIDWEWKKSHQCSPTSPAFTLTDVPSETAFFEISMIDQNYKGFNHGGGFTAHSGGTTASVPEGALKNYKGPCPPNFSSSGHEYEFTVRAMAADGKTDLARGKKTKTFSASTVTN